MRRAVGNFGVLLLTAESFEALPKAARTQLEDEAALPAPLRGCSSVKVAVEGGPG